MADSLTYKILKAHCAEGTPTPGAAMGMRVDQTLTQDATGTVAYLQLEAMGIERVRTELSVSYVDHNTLQSDFRNADDHRYLQSVAARCGIVFSRPGNGICHQVHLERFGRPGRTLLGSDSHTPTCGALGMMAIGAGGLDVACAMAGLPFHLTGPRVVRVVLTGSLPDWVAAKDVILELLRRLSVRGGVGKVFEYDGPGVGTLTVPQRATIANMGAELGATTSVFPSDDVTLRWLRAQRREEAYEPMAADPDAEYDETIEVDLSSLEPLIAQPHSPDNVVPVAEIAGLPVNQVCIGSCTNSSYRDLATAGGMLAGRKVAEGVSLTVSPGSMRVMDLIARDGTLADICSAGARLLELACGPCIGMGQAPCTDAVSLRTFNRNFAGRTGTMSAGAYLCSVETAVAAALAGEIADPRRLGEPPLTQEPDLYPQCDNLIEMPPQDGSGVEVLRGPNIKPIPERGPLPAAVESVVLLKVGDNVTTDHIMPAGAKILPLRSNIPSISEHVFEQVDPEFASRAKAAGGGVVVGGENYGQGSSREHAALAPMHLGVVAVLAKGFARIHKANLVNFGILPLTFARASDYDRVARDDVLAVARLAAGVRDGRLTVEDKTQGFTFEALCELTEAERATVEAGGKLNTVGN